MNQASCPLSRIATALCENPDISSPLVDDFILRFSERDEPALQLLLSCESAYVRDIGLYIYSKVVPAGPDLLEFAARAIDEASEYARDYIIEILVQLAPELNASQISRLFPLFSDPDPVVRVGVSMVLERIDQAELRCAIEGLADDALRAIHLRGVRHLIKATPTHVAIKALAEAEPVEACYAAARITIEMVAASTLRQEIGELPENAFPMCYLTMYEPRLRMYGARERLWPG